MAYPSIGRIVHFVQDGACQAAIVTRVRDRESGSVDLHVFGGEGRAEGMQWNASAAYAEGRIGGTWHWPEREDG